MGAMLNVGFIGAGTVGTALAVLLSGQGYPVVAVYSRSRASAEKLAGAVSDCRVVASSQEVADSAELTFITTPDGAIGEVASQVRWRRGTSVVHCSGADSTDILVAARLAGAQVGAFHPLQTFAGVARAIENIPGTTFAIEAAGPLLTTLEEMAASLGGRSIRLQPGDKVLYHAAAVFASNYLVTLVKMATDLWQTFSIPTDQSIPALLPLLRGTLHNIETIGIPDCLTGPIARGDAGTIVKHLKALRQKAPELLFAYKELGLQTVPIAVAKGKIGREQADEMEIDLKAN
jgi:predicted short-subunit dehydrogenase-like oxidoreductase (DUF2520 family)